MKMRPWIPVLVGVVLLSGTAGQAWCQPKCAPGVIYRCARPAVIDKSCGPSDACRPCNACGQKSCGKTDLTCCVRSVPKPSPCVPRKVVTASEPRRLVLSHGSCKRIVPHESPKAGSGCGPAKTGGCPCDCRHETIFGTETIFGDLALRQPRACPSGCGTLGGVRPLAGVLARLDASLEKVFVCDRETCGKSNGKGGCECGGKTKYSQDMRDAPILEGQTDERPLEENPFRDDAVESDAEQPAPLPPAPLPPVGAAASRIRGNVPPSRPGFAHISDRASNPAAAPQVGAPAADRLAPVRRSILDRPSGPATSRRPPALLSSFKLD